MTIHPRRRDDEGGLTLIELLVVILILGIVSSIVLSATVAGLKATRRSQDRVVALNELTTSLERVAREVRAAYEIDLTGLPNIASANSYIGANVERAGKVFKNTFFLSTTSGVTQLRVRIDQVVGAVVTPGLQAALITSTANNNTDLKLVTWYDAAGLELTCLPADTVTLCAERLGAAHYIELKLVRELAEQNPVIVQTVVNIRSTRIR